MNTIWSKYVQGTKTLYYSRKLRFDDLFSDQYRDLFELDAKQELRILEIGCGPGALAGALHRYDHSFPLCGRHKKARKSLAPLHSIKNFVLKYA